MFIIRVAAFLFYFLPCVSMADTSSSGSLGDIANNLMEPVSILSSFISSISITIGVAFIFGAFFKYMQYRVNPLAVPISTPVLLLLMGVVLVVLPLAYKLSGADAPVMKLKSSLTGISGTSHAPS